MMSRLIKATPEMKNDTAFQLKQEYDMGTTRNVVTALSMMAQSDLMKMLTSDFGFDILGLINRLTQLSEIPFSQHHPKVKKWTQLLGELGYCGEGFSITGKADDLLSCYNAMATTALVKMEYTDVQKIRAGIDWILKYQNVKRGEKNQWPGGRLLKYGGCMKSTPCYIGLVKSMIALSAYRHSSYYNNESEIDEKLGQGIDYILQHQLYKQQSTGKPITNYITLLTYPFSYKTNVIEVLKLIKENNRWDDPRCQDAKDLILQKRKSDGMWRPNSSYQPKDWVLFDKPGQPGIWISYEIEKLFA